MVPSHVLMSLAMIFYQFKLKVGQAISISRHVGPGNIYYLQDKHKSSICRQFVPNHYVNHLVGQRGKLFPESQGGGLHHLRCAHF